MSLQSLKRIMYGLEEMLLPHIRSLRDKQPASSGSYQDSDFPDEVKSVLAGIPLLMEECPDAPAGDFSFQAVRSLGQRKNDEKNLHLKANEAALGIFAQLRRPFALRYASKDMESTFSIGVGKEYVPSLNGLLSGAFGYAVTEKDCYKATGSAQYARCGYVRMDMEAAQRPMSENNLATWLDLAAKVPLNGDCSITIVFTPVDAFWLEQHIKELHRTLDIIGRYADMSIEISGSMSYSKQESSNLGKNLIREISTPEKIELHPNMSVSQSVKSTFSQVQAYADQLNYRLNEFKKCAQSDGWNISICVQGTDAVSCEILKAALGSSMLQRGYSCRWQDETGSAMILPSYKLAEVVSFPSRDFPGLKMDEMYEYELNPPKCHENASGIDLGPIFWGNDKLNRRFYLDRQQLNRHAFVCGKSGSGKSNTVCHILKSLGDIPFLVIEPVKGEYRTLAASVKNTRVYTMDAGSTEQLPINPFWFPEGSSLQYHISCLLATISSAFDLYAAMPNILEQCLMRVYTKLGWNLITNTNAFRDDLPVEHLYPTFDMLCIEVEQYLEKDFAEGELKSNYKNALLARLRTFTSGAKAVLLNQPAITPIAEWYEGKINVILELDALCDEDRAIVMGALIAQYFQYIKYCRQASANEKLRHVFVLEEAHHIFAEDSSSANGNEACKKLVETLSNLLAEIRAYGEGVIIVDQSPSRISKEVQKNTNVKIIHNVDFGSDLKILQDGLLLHEDDRYPARLDVGMAMVRCGIMDRPSLICVPECMEKSEHVFVKNALSATSYTTATLLDAASSNNDFMQKTKYLCGLLVNQILYSDIWEINAAMEVMFKALGALVVEFGFHDMLKDVPVKEFYLPLLQNCVNLYISSEESFRKQTRFSKMLTYFIQQILDVYVNCEYGISEGEWVLLEHYRAEKLYPMLEWQNGYNHEFIELTAQPHMKSAFFRMQLLKKLFDNTLQLHADTARSDKLQSDAEEGIDDAAANIAENDLLFEKMIGFVEDQLRAMNMFLVLPKGMCILLAGDLLAVLPQSSLRQIQARP